MLKAMKKGLLTAALILVSGHTFAACMKEGDKVTLTGVIKKELFYGPPNFGEDKQTDEKLLYWILYPDTPLTCVADVDDTADRWNKQIQLIISHDDYQTKKSLLNTRVSVTGEIMLAQTGYHVTPVLLDHTTFVEK